MQKKVPSLSVFFPFYNEEANIEKVVKKAIPIIENLADKWEIIMVNDGSKDKTEDVGKRLESDNPNLRLISHHPNQGYGGALRSGFYSAKYDLIAFTDGDGQFDIKEITRFLDKIDKADLVIGYRINRRDPPHRRLIQLLFHTWDFILFGFTFKDIDCGFKMIKKEALYRIPKLFSGGAMITTELLAKAKKEKLKIAQVPVHHYPRLSGKQTGGNIKVIIRAVKETFQLRLALQKTPSESSR